MGPLSLQFAGDVDRLYSAVEVIADEKVILSINTDDTKLPEVNLATVNSNEMLSIRDVADLLQQVLHVWRCGLETADQMRRYAARGTDPEADWIGLDLRTLDELRAFDAMRAFLEERSRQGKTDIAECLIDLDRTGWRSGMPINPETWPEWRRAVDGVI